MGQCNFFVDNVNLLLPMAIHSCFISSMNQVRLFSYLQMSKWRYFWGVRARAKKNVSESLLSVL